MEIFYPASILLPNIPSMNATCTHEKAVLHLNWGCEIQCRHIREGGPTEYCFKSHVGSANNDLLASMMEFYLSTY